MLDFLDDPVSSWLFFGFAILIIFELRKFQKKAVVGKLKKNNVNDKINEETYIFPKQEVFILSKYGSELEDDLNSFNNISGKSKKSRFELSGMRKAKVLSDFGFYQQYLNQFLSDGFIVERTDEIYSSISTYDGPDTAICFVVYKGRFKLGIIEVSDDNFMNDGQKPKAKITVKFNWPALLDYRDIYSFLIAIARTHFEPEPSETNTNFKLQIQEALTEYLWNIHHREEANSFTSENDQFEHERTIQISFSGTYDHYQALLDDASPEQMFSREKSAIDSLQEHLGYKRVEKV